MCVKDDGASSNKLIETTVGRVIFNQFVPKEVGFINALLLRRTFVRSLVISLQSPTFLKLLSSLMILKHLVSVWHSRVDCHLLLMILIIPDIKEELVENAKGEVDEVWDNYNMGLITNNERYNQIVDIWSRVDTRITETLIRELSNR